MSVSFTVYLSPIEPSTLIDNINSTQGISSNEDEEDSLILYLMPQYMLDAPIKYIEGVRENIDDSMYQVLGGEDFFTDLITWKKASFYAEGFGASNIKDLPGIYISIKNPTGRIEGIPYWFETNIHAYNPVLPITKDLIYAYQKANDPSELRGETQSEKWIYNLKSSITYQETQPTVNPGEYLQYGCFLFINNKHFSIFSNVKFETPLLTGGWIISKEEGETPEETTYTIEIFGKQVSGIKATDFFDYTESPSTNRWVFLMKVSSSYSEGNYQTYGLSNIDEVSEDGTDYRIVPFNIEGLTSTYCAIPSEDAIFLTPTLDYHTFFSMRKYVGRVVTVNDDTLDVDVPGASIHTLPVFYYCEGSENPEEGIQAFNEHDEVLIEMEELNNWDTAKVIGFVDEIKPCKCVFSEMFILPDYSYLWGTYENINYPSSTGITWIQEPNCDVSLVQNVESIEMNFHYTGGTSVVEYEGDLYYFTRGSFSSYSYRAIMDELNPIEFYGDSGAYLVIDLTINELSQAYTTFTPSYNALKFGAIVLVESVGGVSRFAELRFNLNQSGWSGVFVADIKEFLGFDWKVVRVDLSISFQDIHSGVEGSPTPTPSIDSKAQITINSVEICKNPREGATIGTIIEPSNLNLESF